MELLAMVTDSGPRPLVLRHGQLHLNLVMNKQGRLQSFRRRMGLGDHEKVAEAWGESDPWPVQPMLIAGGTVVHQRKTWLVVRSIAGRVWLARVNARGQAQHRLVGDAVLTSAPLVPQRSTWGIGLGGVEYLFSERNARLLDVDARAGDVIKQEVQRCLNHTQ